LVIRRYHRLTQLKRVLHVIVKGSISSNHQSQLIPQIIKLFTTVAGIARVTTTARQIVKATRTVMGVKFEICLLCLGERVLVVEV